MELAMPEIKILSLQWVVLQTLIAKVWSEIPGRASNLAWP